MVKPQSLQRCNYMGSQLVAQWGAASKPTHRLEGTHFVTSYQATIPLRQHHALSPEKPMCNNSCSIPKARYSVAALQPSAAMQEKPKDYDLFKETKIQEEEDARKAKEAEEQRQR